jgi:hypothetical protein
MLLNELIPLFKCRCIHGVLASSGIGGDRRFLGDSVDPPCAPPSRGIPLLRRPLRRREGEGSPAPACIYGRVGWSSRRRRSGGVGAAGGWFGVGATFSGGGAPRGSSSSRSTCRGSRPGVVLESFGLPSDLCWRRIWWPDLRAGQARWFLSAWWRRRLRQGGEDGAGGHSPCSFIGISFRRCAADGPCGGLLQERCSRGVVRRGTAAFASMPVELLRFALALYPLRMMCCISFLYYVLCTWYYVEYTWAFKKKK